MNRARSYQHHMPSSGHFMRLWEEPGASRSFLQKLGGLTISSTRQITYPALATEKKNALNTCLRPERGTGGHVLNSSMGRDHHLKFGRLAFVHWAVWGEQRDRSTVQVPEAIATSVLGSNVLCFCWVLLIRTRGLQKCEPAVCQPIRSLFGL